MGNEEVIKIESVSVSPNVVNTKETFVVKVKISWNPDHPYDYPYDYKKEG